MVDLLLVLVLKGHSAGVPLLLPDRLTQAVKVDEDHGEGAG